VATGNKSEVAVGYSTLYGDTCGGYAPISDVFKTEVYAICRWLNSQGTSEVIPERILLRAPSAELRPDQKDEDSLPNYALLDEILQALHRKRGIRRKDFTIRYTRSHVFRGDPSVAARGV